MRFLDLINIQNGVVLEEDTVWKCVFNLVYVHDNSKGKDRGLKNQGYILAQPVFDRLRCILCCFIYFQVMLFWLLLYIIYQSKSNTYRAIKF